MTSVKTPSEKCNFASNIASLLVRQYTELYKPQDIEKIDEADKQAEEAKRIRAQVRNQTKRLSAEKADNAESITANTDNTDISDKNADTLSVHNSSAERTANPFWNKDREIQGEKQDTAEVPERDSKSETKRDTSVTQDRRNLFKDASSRMYRNTQRYSASQDNERFSVSRVADNAAKQDNAVFSQRDNERFNVFREADNTSALINVINTQNAIIAQQSKVIAEQNEKLLDITKEFIALTGKQSDRQAQIISALIEKQDDDFFREKTAVRGGVYVQNTKR